MLIYTESIIQTFEHNFGKCRPIFKIISLTDFPGNYITIMGSSICVATLPCEIQNSKIADLLLIPWKLIEFSWNLTKRKQHLDDKRYKNISHDSLNCCAVYEAQNVDNFGNDLTTNSVKFMQQTCNQFIVVFLINAYCSPSTWLIVRINASE